MHSLLEKSKKLSRFAGWLIAGPLALSLHAGAYSETVARYGISMADIPLTTGQPDRGAGAYQFTGHTIYDPLVAWESNIDSRPGKLIPGLATEFKVDPKDAKKWVFKLRQGVKFHDGTPLTADDVVFSFNRARESGVTFKLYATQSGVPRKIDDYTVEFTTAIPNPVMLAT